jgi:hypothetical protein
MIERETAAEHPNPILQVSSVIAHCHVQARELVLECVNWVTKVGNCTWRDRRQGMSVRLDLPERQLLCVYLNIFERLLRSSGMRLSQL